MFKLTLVKEFYRMRQILLQRKNTEWLQTREQGELIRHNETDAIQLLILYAEGQGSQNADLLVLMLVALIEDVISHTTLEEMAKNVYYKDIYQICKDKEKQFARLAYLKVS